MTPSLPNTRDQIAELAYTSRFGLLPAAAAPNAVQSICLAGPILAGLDDRTDAETNLLRACCLLALTGVPWAQSPMEIVADWAGQAATVLATLPPLPAPAAPASSPLPQPQPESAPE